VHDLGKIFMNACWHVDACCEMIFFSIPYECKPWVHVMG
jgi:hypothetical protein